MICGADAYIILFLQTEQAFQELCLIFCELTSLLMLANQFNASPNATSGPRRRTASHPRQNVVEGVVPDSQVDAVREYIFRLFRTGSSSSSAIGRPLSSSVYTLLLPTIWCLMNAEQDGEATNEALQVVVEHAIRTSSTSQVKKASIEFVGRIVLVCSSLQC
jgi:pre-rRNA-processing protein IPI1